MAVTLEITFTGMFTFVPSSDGKELVVLLPRTGVLSPANRVHQHHAYVVLEREHEKDKPHHPTHHKNCTSESAQSGDQQAAPGHDDHAGHSGDSEAHGREEEKFKWEYIPFGRYRLVFKGLAAGSLVDPPQEGVVDLTGIVEKNLDRKQLSLTPDDSVWAQVVLPGATTAPAAGDTAEWKMGEKGKKSLMTHQVIWTTEVADVACIEFWHLGGGKAGELELKPKGTETKISLKIEHLPHANDRHKGQQCLDAPHFMAYYDLFGITREKPLPILTDPKKVDDKLTCMTSQAKVG